MKKKALKKTMKNDALREKVLIKSVNKNSKMIIYEAFDFIGHEDLEELLHLNDDLQEIIYFASKTEFNNDVYIKLRSTFSLFCFTLRYYDEISKLTLSINDFLNLLNTQKERFLLLDKFELELLYGFIGNIDRWIMTLFVKGGADLHFMDNSIKADCETISQIITPKEEDMEFNLDDIFDF